MTTPSALKSQSGLVGISIRMSFWGREFDLSQKFLPDGLSKVNQLDFLNEEERKFS